MTAKHFRALADAISKMDLDNNDRDHVAVEIGDLFLYWSRGYHK